MDGNLGGLKGGSKDERSKEVEQYAETGHAKPISQSQEGTVHHAETGTVHHAETINNHSTGVEAKHAKAISQKDGEVEQTENPRCNLKDDVKVELAESISKPRDVKVEGNESNSQSKEKYVKDAESTIQSKVGRVDNTEPVERPKAGKVEKAESIQGAKYPLQRKKFKKAKASGVDKLKGRFRSFRETVKKYWDVWSRFKTKNTKIPKPSTSKKTLGVPGFEEIACIEAEVPDIMMTDKDRVRTSCRECMKDPPAFPTKEQIKAKLIAADKYYGVKSEKTKSEQSDTLEHDADYYDTDGSVVRPSWRFILERPLVEQYVLMTNYIRKVSVLSELKDEKSSKKFIEEEDSGSDTEYKKFEQKFIKEKRELLKPMQKPKTQDMSVQTSSEPKRDSCEDLKESVSEISLYPESEESTNSPEASAVTIVTSRDYTSPLQSDFDGRTTDKSASFKGGKWWESQATCEPSESLQTSYDSINKNTSSGSDGQSVPIHSAWGNTALQPAKVTFSNESDSRIIPHNRSIEPSMHKKPKDTKKVSFSPVVTYYQGPNKNAALYSLVEGQDIETETNQRDEVQGMEPGNATENERTVPTQDQRRVALENQTNGNPLQQQRTEERATIEEELPHEKPAERPKPSNRKVSLQTILQEKKRGQIVSVSVPVDWHEDLILRDKKMVNVSVSRSCPTNQSVMKKVSFQEVGEIPDVEFSNPHVTTVQEKTDFSIQTQTLVAQKRTNAEKSKTNKHRESPSSKQALDDKIRNPRQSKRQPIDNFAYKQENKIPNDELNLAGRPLYGETDSTGKEANIQTDPIRLTRAGPRTEMLGIVEQRFDDRRTKPKILDGSSTSDATVHQLNFPGSDLHTGNSPYSQPEADYTGTTIPRNPKALDVRPSTSPNQKPIPTNSTNPLIIRGESRQQHSTDTEGPSSSSNEHIKLKASPPCFFKVATPPDLSRISVDEFYPDVPEIDAELSQMSENKTSSAPRVEIVFANKESALRYIQDAEFHRVSKKEENTMLQKSMKTTRNDSPIIMNDPNKGKTIIASAGVGIKIAEDIEKSKDKRQDKSGNIVANKAPTKDTSQQSIITQNSEESSLIDQSLIESGGEPIKPKICQAKLCKTDLRSPAMKLEPIQDYEDHKIKLGEAKQTAQQLLDDKDVTSRRKLKINVTTEQMSNVSAPGRCMLATGLSKTCEETTPSKKTVYDRSEIGKDHRGIEKREEGGTYENLVHDEDDDEIIKIPRQLDSLPTDSQSTPHGWTKLYLRTLSSLAEETSSAVESTCSTQEKLIDMPTMERSVEELKTIFEKPVVASESGESEIQVVESHSDPKKCVDSLKEKLDNGSGKLVPVEIDIANDDGEKTKTSGLGGKSDGKFSNTSVVEKSNSRGMVTPAGVGMDVSNFTDPSQAETSSLKADKPVKFENLLGGRDSRNRPALIEEESSVQQIGQIDVIRASEIYSNTSMYFSSSEDRVAKLKKARTGFQPVTLVDDLASSASSRDTDGVPNDNPGEPKVRQLGSNKSIASKEPRVAAGKSMVHADSKTKEQGMKRATNNEGDNSPVGQGMRQTSAGKEDSEPEEAQQSQEPPPTSQTHTGTEDQPDPIAKAKSGTDDTGNPSETKHWLMDVIPVLSKNTRFRGIRRHKPICVKEATEAEVVKYRQDAVKPVFRFLKRQREMEENKE